MFSIYKVFDESSADGGSLSPTIVTVPFSLNEVGGILNVCF